MEGGRKRALVRSHVRTVGREVGPPSLPLANIAALLALRAEVGILAESDVVIVPR